MIYYGIKLRHQTCNSNNYDIKFKAPNNYIKFTTWKFTAQNLRHDYLRHKIYDMNTYDMTIRGDMSETTRHTHINHITHYLSRVCRVLYYHAHRGSISEARYLTITPLSVSSTHARAHTITRTITHTHCLFMVRLYILCSMFCRPSMHYSHLWTQVCCHTWHLQNCHIA